MKFQLTVFGVLTIALPRGAEAARGVQADLSMNLRRRKTQRGLMMEGNDKDGSGNGGGGGGAGGIGGSGFWDMVLDQVRGAPGSEDSSDPNNVYGYDGANYQNDFVSGGTGFPGGVNSNPDGTPSADVLANSTIAIPYGPPPDNTTNGITYGPPPNNTGYTYTYVPAINPQQPTTVTATTTLTGGTSNVTTNTSTYAANSIGQEQQPASSGVVVEGIANNGYTGDVADRDTSDGDHQYGWGGTNFQSDFGTNGNGFPGSANAQAGDGRPIGYTLTTEP